VVVVVVVDVVEVEVVVDVVEGVVTRVVVIFSSAVVELVPIACLLFKLKTLK